MENLLAVMMRLRNARNLDSRHAAAVDAAYFACRCVRECWVCERERVCVCACVCACVRLRAHLKECMCVENARA
jgi:hypothetical protein